MRIKITADSTCDLSEELLAQWDIALMPMHILMGEDSYLDGVTIHPADVFAYVNAGGKMPKSAAANLVEYTDFFEPFAKECDAVIHISVSSKLSSCFQNAKLAAGEFENVQYGAYTHHIIIGHSCVEYKEEVFVMIVYDRLWITLKKKNISQYALIKDYGIDKAQLQRLRKNMVVKTVILNRLCSILDCKIEDIMEFVPDEDIK